MKVISFIGWSGSGKTSLMEYLIKELSNRGLKVIAVKHIHSPVFDVDKEGKDTWRLFNAGAEAVVGASSERLYIFSRTREIIDIDTLCNTMEILHGDLDFILIEGRIPSKQIEPWNVLIIGDDDRMDVLKNLNDKTLAIICPKSFERLSEIEQITKKPIIRMDQKSELLRIILELKG